MNFIAATVELRSTLQIRLTLTGLTIVALMLSCPLVVVLERSSSASSATTEPVQSSLPFQDWKPGTRALVTGNLVFSDDTSQPLDLIVTTIWSPTFLRICTATKLYWAMPSLGLTKSVTVRTVKLQSRLAPHSITLKRHHLAISRNS